MNVTTASALTSRVSAIDLTIRTWTSVVDGVFIRLSKRAIINGFGVTQTVSLRLRYDPRTDTKEAAKFTRNNWLFCVASFLFRVPSWIVSFFRTCQAYTR